MRAASNALQKTIHELLGSIGVVFYATMVIGFVQMVLGFVLARLTGVKLYSGYVVKDEKTDEVVKVLSTRKAITGSFMFGTLATACVTLSFLAFSHGGDISLHIFITTLGIIPGALFDKVFFKHVFTKLNILGIFLAIVAGLIAVEAPLMKFQTWMIFSGVTMLLMAINQAITSEIKDIHPFVKNFWGGIPICLFAGIGTMIFGSVNIVTGYSAEVGLISVAVGVLSVILWTVNLYAYRDGAFIALKKLVMNGSFIIIGAIFGTAFFKESISVYLMGGVVLYFVAFILLDNDTWNYFFNKSALDKVES